MSVKPVAAQVLPLVVLRADDRNRRGRVPGVRWPLRLLATIAHPPTIAAILRHLGLPVGVLTPVPARQADWRT